MACALIGCPVAEEYRRYKILSPDLRGKGRAGRHGDGGTNDSGFSQNADREVGEVHRSALALAVAIDPSVKLGHRPIHVTALGERVAVRAVVASYVIGVSEGGANAHGHGFFTNVWVCGASEFSGGVNLNDLHFKVPDGPTCVAA